MGMSDSALCHLSHRKHAVIPIQNKERIEVWRICDVLSYLIACHRIVRERSPKNESLTATGKDLMATA